MKHVPDGLDAKPPTAIARTSRQSPRLGSTGGVCVCVCEGRGRGWLVGACDPTRFVSRGGPNTLPDVLDRGRNTGRHALRVSARKYYPKRRKLGRLQANERTKEDGPGRALRRTLHRELILGATRASESDQRCERSVQSSFLPSIIIIIPTVFLFLFFPSQDSYLYRLRVARGVDVL